MATTEILVAISSALIGVVGTLIAQEYRAKRRKDQRINTIRTSIYSEIKENDEILNEIENPNGASGSILSISTYEAVSDEVGLLDPPESKAVIRYYNRVNQINSLGDKIQGIPQDELRDSMTHHIVLDTWRKARRRALSNADTALEVLNKEEYEY